MVAEAAAKQAQWQKLFGYVLGNQAAWIADIGLKTGLFRAIADAGDGGVGEEALAERLGFNRRYVTVWSRAAYAFEFLDWDEATGYRFAPHMAALLLDPADPQFMGGRIQFYTALYEDFRAFPSFLRSGETWPRSEHDPWLLDALANLTKPDATVITEHVLPQAPATLARLKAGGTILDIGPSGGFHMAHYAKRFPRCRVVGLEVDAPSVPLAERTLAEAGVGDRAEVRLADANELDEEEAYDLVTMSIALHETGGPAEYRNVMRRVRRALKPEGTVVVSELPYPDSPRAYREEAVYKGLAGVQLHEAIVGCGAIPKESCGSSSPKRAFPTHAWRASRCRRASSCSPRSKRGRGEVASASSRAARPEA